MTQQLRVHVSLAKDPDSVPSDLQLSVTVVQGFSVSS